MNEPAPPLPPVATDASAFPPVGDVVTDHCPVAFCRAEAGHRTLHDIRACTRDCGPILDGKPRAWHAKDCPNGVWLTRLAERQAAGGAS